MQIQFPFVLDPAVIIKQRENFAEAGIKKGKNVVAFNYKDGVILLAENPSYESKKIWEIHDKIAYAGAGNYSEYEEIRRRLTQQADLTAYSYSRDDVFAKSLVNDFLSPLIKLAFVEGIKPYEIAILLAELGKRNIFYEISYKGIPTPSETFASIGGSSDKIKQFMEKKFNPNLDLEDAILFGRDALIEGLIEVEMKDKEKSYQYLNNNIEIAILDRKKEGRKFREISNEKKLVLKRV